MSASLNPESLKSDIELIQNLFHQAERETDVERAVVILSKANEKIQELLKNTNISFIKEDLIELQNLIKYRIDPGLSFDSQIFKEVNNIRKKIFDKFPVSFKFGTLPPGIRGMIAGDLTGQERASFEAGRRGKSEDSQEDQGELARVLASKFPFTKEELEEAGTPVKALALKLKSLGMTFKDFGRLEAVYGITPDAIKEAGSLEKAIKREFNALITFASAAHIKFPRHFFGGEAAEKAHLDRGEPFPASFEKLKQLHETLPKGQYDAHIVLDHRSTAVLPSKLPFFPKLISLEISDPNLKEFPRCFLNQKNLQHLIIYGSPIGSLPKEITNLNKLKELHVTGCSLKTFPPFPDSLQVLDVRNNPDLPPPPPEISEKLAKIEYFFQDKT